MSNVLHITVHMGGGVGKALSDITNKSIHNNKIILLQRPEKDVFIKKSNSEVIVCPSENQIKLLIEWSDVVVVSWWHHPLLYSFLYNFPEVSCRLVLWSHVSGCNYPYLNPIFLNKFDYLFATSECIYDNIFWTDEEMDEIKAKSSVIYGLGRLDIFEKKEQYSLISDKVRIGYTGTFARSKMHPDFVKICKNIVQLYPNVEFVLIGDIESGEWIRNEANEYGISDKFIFTGFLNDVRSVLQQLDIFGYPLNSYNFATTENGILEAMKIGLPVVLMNQGTEKYIVSSEIGGILAEDEDDYVSSIYRLIQSEELRKTLGGNAIIDVDKKFSFEKNVDKFDSCIDEISLVGITSRNFSDFIGDSPYDWFISGTNKDDYEKIIHHEIEQLQFIFKEKSKGSILHFAHSYPRDKNLNELKNKIEGID